MIKVREGQVWFSSFSEKEITMTKNDEDRDFNSPFYKFIPQNDLEFAAVTLDKWPPRTAQIHVKGGEILGCLLHNPSAINECQWQNMRYHLGLDKKPRYDLTKCEWVKQ